MELESAPSRFANTPGARPSAAALREDATELLTKFGEVCGPRRYAGLVDPEREPALAASALVPAVESCGAGLSRFVDALAVRWPAWSGAARLAIAAVQLSADAVDDADAAGIPASPVTTRALPRVAPSIDHPGGRYEILEPIGEGAYGEVFLARDATLSGDGFESLVAVKFIPCDASRAEPILREALLMRAAAVDGAARVLDAGTCADPAVLSAVSRRAGQAHAVFVVSEWIDGLSLAHWKATLGEDSTRERLDMCVEILATLQSLHGRGISHGDLSPRNVLVTRDTAVDARGAGGTDARPGAGERPRQARSTPRGEHPRLVDFGLARRAEESRAGDTPPRDGETPTRDNSDSLRGRSHPLGDLNSLRGDPNSLRGDSNPLGGDLHRAADLIVWMFRDLPQDSTAQRATAVATQLARAADGIASGESLPKAIGALRTLRAARASRRNRLLVAGLMLALAGGWAAERWVPAATWRAIAGLPPPLEDTARTLFGRAYDLDPDLAVRLLREGRFAEIDPDLRARLAAITSANRAIYLAPTADDVGLFVFAAACCAARSDNDRLMTSGQGFFGYSVHRSDFKPHVLQTRFMDVLWPIRAHAGEIAEYPADAALAAILAAELGAGGLPSLAWRGPDEPRPSLRRSAARRRDASTAATQGTADSATAQRAAP